MATLARITQPTLTRSESRFLAKLSALTRQSDPLRFIWQVINSRPAVAGDDPTLWLVPSARIERVSYTIDTDARLCSCEGFYFKHHCSHIRVADFAARLRYELINAGINKQHMAAATAGKNPNSSPLRTGEKS